MVAHNGNIRNDRHVTHFEAVKPVAFGTYVSPSYMGKFLID